MGFSRRASSRGGRACGGWLRCPATLTATAFAPCIRDVGPLRCRTLRGWRRAWPRCRVMRPSRARSASLPLSHGQRPGRGPRLHFLPAFGLRVWGLWFRLSGFGFKRWGLGLRIGRGARRGETGPPFDYQTQFDYSTFNRSLNIRLSIVMGLFYSQP